MRRAIFLVGALLAVTALPGLAHAQQPDPFADENNTTTSDNSSDPFTGYEQSKNDSFQAKQNATTTKDTSSTTTANTSAKTTSTPPTTTEPASQKGTPGFEVIAAIGAVAAAMLVLRRR